MNDSCASATYAARVRYSPATMSSAATTSRRAKLFHGHARELALSYLEQMNSGGELGVGVRDALAFHADAALRDEPARLRSRRGQPELRQRLDEQHAARFRGELALLDVVGDFAPGVHQLEMFLGGAGR